MWQDILTVCSFVFSLVGIITLLYMRDKTKSSTTPVDDDYSISPWFTRIAYSLITLGFLCVISASIVSAM
jgi:hypothetical protein